MEDNKPKTVAGGASTDSKRPGRSFGNAGGTGGRPRRKMGDRREKSEFDQKILSVRRVTRVMAGGRRFSFSTALLLGDKKGSVGLGLGKSADTTLAINKAVSAAKKSMIKIPVNKDMSIQHIVEGKFKASRVMLMPNRGKGVVAGGAVRNIFLLAGLKNVTGKILSPSKNHLNNAKAVMVALRKLKSRNVPVVAVPKETSEAK